MEFNCKFFKICCQKKESKSAKIDKQEELRIVPKSDELIDTTSTSLYPINLSDREWRLTKALINKENYSFLGNDRTITFNNKKINGFDGCNNYLGNYTLDTCNNISIGILGSNKKYCEYNPDYIIYNTSEKIRFIDLLSNVKHYRIEEDYYNYKLYLYSYYFTLEFSSYPQVVPGRPIKEDNKNIVAEICEEKNKDITWSDYTFSEGLKQEIISMTSDDKEKFIIKWLEAAQHEHSSVSSFAQIILELSRYGAPSRLLELTNKAMLDEINHTKIALGLASIASNKRYSLTELKLNNIIIRDKKKFKEENYIDACINEKMAAKSLYDESMQYEETKPELAKILKQMSYEEESHAELGFKIDQFLHSCICTF